MSTFSQQQKYVEKKQKKCLCKQGKKKAKHFVLFSSNVHMQFSQTFIILTRHLPLITVFRCDQSRGHAAWSNQSVIT